MASLIDQIDDFLSTISFHGEYCNDSYLYTNLGNDGRNYLIIIQVIDDDKYLIHVSIDGIVYNKGMEISSFIDFEVFYRGTIEQYF